MKISAPLVLWTHSYRTTGRAIITWRYLSNSSNTRKGKLRSDVATLVSCDVFITAGAHKELHTPLLRNLLQRTQERLRSQIQLPSSSSASGSYSDTGDRNIGTGIAPVDPWVENQPVGALIHARCDPVYNRSSFHLVGSESVIGSVAKELCLQAVRDLRELQQNHAYLTNFTTETHHPNIGLVDHVCTMPLIDAVPPALSTSNATSSSLASLPPPPPLSSASNVARTIGEALRDELDILVFFYGLAHRNRRDYADVRAKTTRYLNRLAGLVPPSDANKARPELCSVGAATHFVEHFAVRLNAVCGKKRARHLRRVLSEYDGKLPHVYTLSLPYTQNRYELSCLLQQPKVSKANDVVTTVQRYIKTCKDEVEIEKCYRLRPTSLQCLDLLRNLSRSEEARTEHDNKLAAAFEQYFHE